MHNTKRVLRWLVYVGACLAGLWVGREATHTVAASNIVQLAYQFVQNQGGANLIQRNTINCVGAGISCSDVAGKTVFNVPGGSSGQVGQVTLVVGSSDITSTGTKACTTAENAFTITQAQLIANAVPTGANLIVDVLKVAFGSYTGFASASSITAAAIPTITTMAMNPRYTDSVLMGWTTSVSAGDVLCVAVNSAPTGGATYASLSLKYTIP